MPQTTLRPSERLLYALSWLWINPLALAGTILSSLGGSAFVAVLLVDLGGGTTNHYASAVGYLVAPAVLVFGLVLLGIGLLFGRRRSPRSSAAGSDDGAAPTEALSRLRRAHGRLWLLAGGTAFNVVVIAGAAYQGVTYTNSTSFCGEACHSEMHPEYRAWQGSPHANVKCVECHVDEGASHAIDSKVTGMRRVWAKLTNTVQRPIPTPLDEPPPRHTCEKCHWPKKFHGPRLLVRYLYESDETNTRKANIVRLDVGGFDRRHGRYRGIHWHVAPDVKIAFEALDRQRREIGKVHVTRGGQTTTFLPAEGSRQKKAVATVEMSCIDCHTRPSHAFDKSPDRAVDEALALGKMDPSLPYLKRESVKLLRQKLELPEQATARFEQALRAFYAQSYPQVAQGKGPAIARAARELGWIYRRNIHPKMNIGWGTYPVHIGHQDADDATAGCFRCHNDEHATARGQAIEQDCDGMCHELIADGEEEPDVSPALLKLGTM